MKNINRLVTLGAALVLFGGPGLALAAAPPQYVSSSPGNGAEVQSPPSSVSITFDQPLDQSSAITSIEDHCGHEVSDGTTQVTGNQMQISMDSEAAGTYHVNYFAKGVGGVTGQQQAMIMFTATDGPSCGKPSHDHMHMGGGMGHHHGHGGMHMGHHGSGHHGHGGMHMGHDGSPMHDMHMGHMSDMGGHSGHSTTHGGGMGGMHMGGHSTHTDHHESIEPLGITSTGTNGDAGLDRAGMATLLTAVLLALGLGAVGGTVLRISEPS